MQNTYGYIRGTESVDGDHIDVFLSDDIDGWDGRKIFVIDQYNEDGSFDVANFDKQGIDAFATAETVTREAEVAQEVEVAQERIKKTRSAKKETKKKSVNLQQSGELGLFDSLFEETPTVGDTRLNESNLSSALVGTTVDHETNNDNGLQRIDATRSEGVSANGNRHEQGLSRGTETGSESEQQSSRGTDNGRKTTGDAVDRTVRPRLSDTVEDKGIEGKRKKDVENNHKLADELKDVTLYVPDTFGVEHELSGFTYYELENVFHFTDNIDGQRNATRKELDAILKIARKDNGKEDIFEPKNTRNNHSERGYNLMEIYSDRKGNLTAKTFYKTRKGSDQRVIDIEKSLLRTSETSLVHSLSGANIPQMFESTSIEEDFSTREGVGSYTDDEVSIENDPISKVYGKSRFTRKQRREFAERERQRMAERVEELAKKLHLDNVEVVTDASQLEGKKQRAKGFYSKSTGKITIVLPNHSSAFDVEQTLLHEAVAHYGLRQLFGEHFDTFLDNVFNNADEAIRQRIVALAAKNGWDFRKATEEYLASLAEDTEFSHYAHWWQEIKRLFMDMLHKIGFDGFRGVTLSDNELRYILWRSYENLAEPGRYRSILGEAADVAKQYELGVGNYAPVAAHESKVAERAIINAANERFNEQLEDLTEKNAQSVILNLGYPGNLLISAGISNRQIRLYGNKVIKKMKKHGFALSDIKNLPLSINNPIAVFNNYEAEGNRAILTELHTHQGNILVTISLGKGSDAKLNIVSSVFGNGQKNIISWINKGYVTYINKEKALKYLRISTPIVEAQDNQELNSATKIVENFENPIIEDDFLYRDGDPEIHERELARYRYERRVKTGMFQSREALQDSMLGLKEAMQAILDQGTNIEDVDGFENAYLGENRLSSVNKAEADAFAQTLFKPMLDEVAKLANFQCRISIIKNLLLI